MLLCNGADIGCVRSTDHITDRESGQTSAWCCTRCDLNNYGDECLVKETDCSSHRTYPTRQSGEVTDCSGTLGQWTPLARVASEPRGKGASASIEAEVGLGCMDSMVSICKLS